MLWLSPEVLNWSAYRGSYSVDDTSLWQRPYAIWNHAEELLSRSRSDFTRSDAITTLRRAVDHRIKHLARIYDFKRLPIPGKPQDIVEILGFVGLVRPLMLGKLIEIRNLLEHEDASPPGYDDCIVFLEFVWYFLRSTDLTVRETLDTFDYVPQDDEAYVIEATVREASAWVFRLGGWVPSKVVACTQIEGWLAVKTSSLTTKAELFALHPDWVDDPHDQRGRYPEDICFEGEVRGPSESLKVLTSKYLQLT
jgi:hypothetical protein